MTSRNRISNNQALLVLCALAFLGAPPGPLSAQGVSARDRIDCGGGRDSIQCGSGRDNVTADKGVKGKKGSNGLLLPQDRKGNTKKSGAKVSDGRAP